MLETRQYKTLSLPFATRRAKVLLNFLESTNLICNVFNKNGKNKLLLAEFLLIYRNLCIKHTLYLLNGNL